MQSITDSGIERNSAELHAIPSDSDQFRVETNSGNSAPESVGFIRRRDGKSAKHNRFRNRAEFRGMGGIDIGIGRNR